MARRDSVVVTSRSFGSGSYDGRAVLRAAGLDVVVAHPDHDLGSMSEELDTAVAWIAGTCPVTKAHLEAGPRLKVIARYGVGVDAVDLAAAQDLGIIVTNTPGANSRAVAEHAMGLMLALLRQLCAGDRAVRQGDWRPRRGSELGSLTVGVVGFGGIGRIVADRLRAFGSRVLAHDPWLASDTVAGAGVQPASLIELAEACDVVTLHASGSQRLITSDWLTRVRPGLVLINTARAGLVDEAAVAVALTEKRMGAYAADTLDAEHGDVSGHPLLAAGLADRTAFTPHSAAQTVQAIDAMGKAAVESVLDVLAGRRPANVVTGK